MKSFQLSDEAMKETKFQQLSLNKNNVSYNS